MYSYESTPYSTNRLQEFGLGLILGSMGYWANPSTGQVVKGYSNKRPLGQGSWRWFPSQSAALDYGKSLSATKPPVVVQPPVKPPIIVQPPPADTTNDTSVARYSISGNVAIPLNDLARMAPPAAPLNTAAGYMWTRRVGDGAWLWKYVPTPDSLYIEPVAVRPPDDSTAPANPIVKWYNKATGVVKDARLLSAPDSSGSWILGSQAVAQGLISAGALYGISAPGGGITVDSGSGITAPVNGTVPAYIDSGASDATQAGFGGIPTWALLAGGAAALFFLMRKK